MNLGEKPCYPSQTKVKMGESLSIIKNNGLTFRERLIVALASNSRLMELKFSDRIEYVNLQGSAQNIINQANAIIKELESRQS